MRSKNQNAKITFILLLAGGFQSSNLITLKLIHLHTNSHNHAKKF
jgi:hypothetical protein